MWPPSFALARAYIDQLERKECFADARVGGHPPALDAAEKASAAQRGTALSTLVTQLEADARGSCDPDKVRKLKDAVQSLQSVVM